MYQACVILNTNLGMYNSPFRGSSQRKLAETQPNTVIYLRQGQGSQHLQEAEVLFTLTPAPTTCSDIQIAGIYEALRQGLPLNHL